MIRTCAPGKLFIAGEWAILEEGASSVLAAINIYVKVDARERIDQQVKIQLSDYGETFIGTWDGRMIRGNKSPTSSFAVFAAEKALSFVKSETGVDLSISSENPYYGAGLGTSSAVTVSVVKAVLELFSMTHDDDTIFKISSIAHLSAQGSGSCADIAASTYGGYISYTRFDPVQIASYKNYSVREIVSANWRGLTIERLKDDAHQLCVGWTKKSASTRHLIEKVMAWKMVDKTAYALAMEHVISAANDVRERWGRTRFAESIRENQRALQRLSDESRTDIMTPELDLAISVSEDLLIPAKLSGAGGGDCAIAFAKGIKEAKSLFKAWIENGILPLDISIEPEGVLREKI